MGPLKHAKVLHDRVNLGGVESGAECGHRARGRTVMDNVKDLLIGEALHFRARGDIRSVLAAAAVEPMAARAGGCEDCAARSCR